MRSEASLSRGIAFDVRRSHAALLGALVLVVPLALLAAAGPVAADSIERVLAIEESDVDASESWRTFDGNPPKVYDFDGDGRLEIIAQNDNHWVYVFDSEDGTLLAELEATVPSGWGARTFNGPEAAVLTAGEEAFLIQASSAAYVTAHRFDASQSTSNAFHFETEWERRLDVCRSDPGMDAKVVFADLDQDGDLEIVAATEESGVYALRHDGSLLWHQCVGGGNAAPGIGDLNGDGRPDVVHVSDGGLVAAFDGRDGDWLWSYDVSASFDLGAGSIPVQPAVAQLDGQGGPDVVLGARDSHDPDNWDDNHALLLALDSDGDPLWWHQHPAANPLTYTRPIVADADEDGQPEVYWGDWNTVGHKPPWDEEEAWAHTGAANFFRYSRTGALEWRTELDTWWSNKDLAIGDVDGDGEQEVLANGPSPDGSEDGIWVLDVETGAQEQFVSVAPWKIQRAPILADLWGSGTMQWVVQVAPATSGVDHAVLVYDTHAGFDALWPHVPYPAEPSADGDFAAQFSAVQGNEWWIQTEVETSGGALSHVDVRLDGGDWRPLQDEGWGWAESYHAPAGTLVQFRATGTAGGTDTSGCYEWTDAEPVPCDDDFRAEFAPASGSNEWWVEVYVSGSNPIAGVDARIDDGPWRALSQTDQGSWARSLHAPDGSLVQFRATGSGGATQQSACYRWTEATETDCNGDFTAEFDPASGVNEWWVEVFASGSDAIQRVDARVDGSEWVALEEKDWGSWAKSLHAPEGSLVQFRAVTTSGATDLSPCYRWTDATETHCNGGFTAEFDPASGSNEWWVEVYVSANEAVARVDARVDGGAWRELEQKDWGSWARSMHAPDGSQVEFRATSEDGDTAMSRAFTWG